MLIPFRVFIALLTTSSMCVAAVPSALGSALELRSAETLPFLTKGQGAQVLTLRGEYRGSPQAARLKLDGQVLSGYELNEGQFQQRFVIPAVKNETRSKLTIETNDGTVLGRIDVVRRPVRELTIYIVPHSHVDIGYTALQPEIETKQVNNLLTALELIERTRSNPSGSQYRWTVEAAWTIDNLLRDRPDRISALRKAIQSHEIELDAAFANLLTALCRPEELIRSYAWGARHGKQLGVPVNAAMISDVPGYTWGTITALAEAGVKYFSIGPNMLDRIGTTLVAWEDRPFYWETPDRQHKVLCWTSYKGYAWSHVIKQLTEDQVAAYLGHLDQIDYAYDVAHIRWSGHGDNAVPDVGLIDSVREWNERYDWPQLKIAVVSEPFQLLEQRYADKIPTLRGDWTPYWEDGAASSALETAMNRATAERLVMAETLWAMVRPASEFPTNEFREAWRSTMLYSEHTWGAHCSVSDPENPLTIGQWNYKRGYAVDADLRSRELLAAAAAGGTQVEGAVDVFNTNSWPRSQVVRVSKQLSAVGDHVLDANGKSVPSQRLVSGDLAFLATDVPAMSSRRFFISAGDASCRALGSGATAAAHSIENAALSVTLEPNTGNVRRLISKSDGFNFVADHSGGLNEYLYVEGDRFNKPQSSSASPSITIGEKGPLVASLIVESSAPGCKKLSREVRLTSGADYLELIDVVDKARVNVTPGSAGGNPQDPNNGKEAVHFAFPFNLPGGEIRMDTPLAVVQPEKDQVPGACKNWFTVQRWIDISNAERGVTWSPIDAPLVQLGGITAALIGSQTNPDVWQKRVEPSQSLYSWAMNNYWHTNYRAYQEGPTIFHYAIRPHGEYLASEAQCFGIERSQPLIVVPAMNRPPLVAPCPKIDGTDVVVTAFKPADDGKGHVVRLFSSGGKDVDMQLAWVGSQPKAVYRSDTLESVGEKAGDVIHIPAWGVVALRVE